MSIGFISLDGKWEGKYYHHKEVYLLENSIVTVACNPDALIGFNKDYDYLVKSYGPLHTVDDLIQAYEKGFMNLPSEIRKSFYMFNPVGSALSTDTHIEKIAAMQESIQKNTEKVTMNNTHPLTPDFTAVQAIVLTDEQSKLYDQDGEAVKKPYPSQKNYHQINELI